MVQVVGAMHITDAGICGAPADRGKRSARRLNEDWNDFKGSSEKHRTARIQLASVLGELAAQG